MKHRNKDILKSFKREISLATRVVKDKSKYSRKEKHKNSLMNFYYPMEYYHKTRCTEV